VTWGVDFTSRARADLVGLQPEVADTITDTLVDWVQNGPPRENERELAGMVFYEASIVDRYLVGYMVKDDPPAFVILWLRRQPGTSG
jgi:hypothetical protein